MRHSLSAIVKHETLNSNEQWRNMLLDENILGGGGWR